MMALDCIRALPRRVWQIAPGALVAVALIPLPALAAKTMFVTLETGTGNLGDHSSWPDGDNGKAGLAAGNSICQNLAQAAGLANYASYRAWLSTSTTDAYCNVAGFAGKKVDSCGQAQLPDAGPWVRTDGKPFARSLSALTTDSAVLYEPFIDQHGNAVNSGSVSVMTGTGAAGVALGSPCSNWTSASSGVTDEIGDLQAGASDWTTWTSANCASNYHLYCFESGTDAPLAPFDAPGADAFVTSGDYDGDLERAPGANGAQGALAGDAICRSVATAAKKPSPDTYVAWLSDGTTNVIDRITSNGPWRRSDGVVVAASKSALTLYPHSGSVSVDELGAYRATYNFSGTTAAGIASLDDCGAWSSTTGTASGGRATLVGAAWTQGFSDDCAVAIYHLVCLANVVTIFADGFGSNGLTAWSSHVP